METLLRTVMRHRAGLSIVNMEDDQDTAVDGASGYTPLHAAAFHGNDDAVRVLLTTRREPADAGREVLRHSRGLGGSCRTHGDGESDPRGRRRYLRCHQLRSRRSYRRHPRPRSRCDRSPVQGVRVLPVERWPMVADARLHAARMGHIARQAERHSSPHRARRRRPNTGRP